MTRSACQAEHDRDTNAARNILARGLDALEKEFEQFAAAAEARAGETAVNKDSGAYGFMAGVGHDPLVAGIIAPSGR